MANYGGNGGGFGDDGMPDLSGVWKGLRRRILPILGVLLILLAGYTGYYQIVARDNEFKCPGCGDLNRRGSRACSGCKKPFCVKCRQRLAVLKGCCHQCMSTLKR